MYKYINNMAETKNSHAYITSISTILISSTNAINLLMSITHNPCHNNGQVYMMWPNVEFILH